MPMMEVVGLASKTSRFIEYQDSELDQTLLEWLRAHQVTIASSCDGEGVCKKCGIQNGWLTCELTLKDLLERQENNKIFIVYL